MTEQMQAKGVDFHCHLDLYPNHEEAITRAESAQIYTLSVTTTPRAWPRNFQLTSRTSYVRAALGLHPQLVANRADELTLWEHHLTETRYVGEVGLDAGPRFYKSLEAQKIVFRRILERCAESDGKILSVHSIRSVRAVLDMIERHLMGSRSIAVLHWFTGSPIEAKRAVSMGCYFSVNAEMTFSERSRAMICSLPMDRILTETDGPFTQVDGSPSEPVNAPATSAAIARLRGISKDVIDQTILSNLQTLLR